MQLGTISIKLGIGWLAGLLTNLLDQETTPCGKRVSWHLMQALTVETLFKGTRASKTISSLAWAHWIID